jgi:hypothetical protein
VKLLGVVKVRGQPKKLGKLCKLDAEPSAVSYPHKDSLFLLKEESGIELCDDLLILVVPKLQKIRDAMKVTSFKNFVESGTLLLPPHIVNVNPLHRDNKPGLPVGHSVIPILLKEGPKTLIGAPFLGLVVACILTEHYNVAWINLVVVDNFPVGVNYWGSHLQALKPIGRGGSGTMRWVVLGTGVLMKTAGP